MAPEPKIALVVGSSRAARLANIPAQWVLAQAQARGDMNVEIVDLRNYPMPLFHEPASNACVAT